MTRAALRRPLTAGRRLLSTLAVVALTLAGLAVIVPSLLGFHLYAIATGSMTGSLDVGTLAVSREVPVTDLEVGDVITYVPPSDTGITHPVTHRITDIDDSVAGLTTFTTKGDANASADPWAFQLSAPTQARVEHAVPFLGRPVLWLADPTTRLVAIGAPAGAVALLSLRDLVRALRPESRDPGDDGDDSGGYDLVIDLPEARGDATPSAERGSDEHDIARPRQILIATCVQERV